MMFGRTAVNARTVCSTLLLIPSLAALIIAWPSETLAFGGNCVYDPGESCCQCHCVDDEPGVGDPEECLYGTEFCFENVGGGGTEYCSSEVCAFETRCTVNP